MNDTVPVKVKLKMCLKAWISTLNDFQNPASRVVRGSQIIIVCMFPIFSPQPSTSPSDSCFLNVTQLQQNWSRIQQN